MMNPQKILEELILNFAKAGLPIKVKKINKKLEYINSVTKLGQCKWDGKEYTIFLSKHAMESEDQIRKTLAHELVHTLPGCMNHGAAFHRYGRIVLKKLGIEVESRASREDAEESGIQDAYRMNANFMILCKNCGTEIYRQRKAALVEHPERYRCSRCKGVLEVYKRGEGDFFYPLHGGKPYQCKTTEGDSRNKKRFDTNTNISKNRNNDNSESTKMEKDKLPGLESWHRYALQCQSCGQVYGRKAMSAIIKNPEKYRCQCKGKLVRIL